MRQTKKIIRIKDIATIAGVSPGTVDRVLHKRGNVSPKSREKVEKALSEIDYTPNVYASALAQKKKTRIICVIPSFKADDYWEYVSRGINRANAEMSMLNVVVEEIYFDQYDVVDFKSSLTRSLAQDPDGIVFPPIYRSESLEFIELIDKRGIPFVFLDSMIEGTNAIAYYGQDSFRSGEIVAKILLATIKKDSSILMFHISRFGDKRSNQITLRQNGFLHFLTTHKATNETFELELDAIDHKKNTLIIDKFLTQYPQITNVVVFNSLGYTIANYLQKLTRPDIKIIGYDVLQRNIESLKRNEISLLIGQRPEEQGYLGVKSLYEHLLFNRKVRKINYMPIDLVIKENVDYA